MKKILLVSLWISLLVLVWCWGDKGIKRDLGEQVNNKELQNKISCSKFFVVWSWEKQAYNLKAKVVASNIKNVVSPSAGIVSYLNCTPWQKVNSKTLIAKISPDWSDPNIKNVVSQKKYIQDQIKNTNSIINSTKLNYSQQLNSLNSQKVNLENQIKILNENLDSLEKQKKYWVGDLQQQLKTLKDQLKDLKISKSKLENSKQADISKLQLSIWNNKESAKSLINNTLLDIDELFGITDTNKHKNDAFENYLSAKNTALKEEIKTDFIKLNSQFEKLNEISNEDFINYIQKVDDLVQKVKQALKASINTRTFPQTQIDALYAKFTNYDNSLIQIKWSLDNLIKSLQTLTNTYDNQIISVQTNINSVQNSIENLEKNKLNSYLASIDVQINQTKSQLQANKTSLENILTSIKNLQNQENISINQLKNQLVQLENSLSSLNIQLSPSSVYAKVEWKVKIKNTSKWNKVWPNTLLCQIIPDKSSLKLQVYWNLGNNWDFGEVEFKDNSWKDCKLKIINKLPYKDPVTQNSIYETENNVNCSIQEWGIISVMYHKWKNENIIWNQKIFIPLNFVVNKLTGQFVKKQFNSWDIQEIPVKLWNIDGTNVEILSWLKIGDRVCR